MNELLIFNQASPQSLASGFEAIRKEVQAEREAIPALMELNISDGFKLKFVANPEIPDDTAEKAKKRFVSSLGQNWKAFCKKYPTSLEYGLQTLDFVTDHFVRYICEKKATCAPNIVESLFISDIKHFVSEKMWAHKLKENQIHNDDIRKLAYAKMQYKQQRSAIQEALNRAKKIQSQSIEKLQNEHPGLIQIIVMSDEQIAMLAEKFDTDAKNIASSVTNAIVRSFERMAIA